MDFYRLQPIAFKLLIASSTLLISYPLMAGQQHYEARSDAMGGAAVASGSRVDAVFSNPALMTIKKNNTSDFSLLFPAVGIDGADPDQIIDQIDDLQDNYDNLNNAINSQNPDTIISSRDALVQSLEQLDDSKAFVNGGLGLSVVLGDFKSGVSAGIFYKSYFDSVISAEIDQQDINEITNIDPLNPPSLTDLQSQGVVLAGAVTDLGMAFSYPTTMVNIPVSVGFSPKFQRLDTYQYFVNVNNFDLDDATEDQFRTEATAFNVDLGMALEPMDGVVLALSARNLIKQELKTTDINNRVVTYQVEPLFTAGASYDWSMLSFTTDIDLNKQTQFRELANSQHQYLRVGGEIRPVDAVALRVGYRKDIENNNEDLLTAGLGLSVFGVFKMDLAAMYGDNDAVGAVLQTSLHF